MTDSVSVLAATTPRYSGLSLSSRIGFILAVILFRVALDVCYFFYVHPTFGTHFLTPMGLDFDIYRYLLSHLMVLFLASFLPNGKQNLSGIFFMSAMMFLFIPMTVMYGFDRNLPVNTIAAGILALIVCYFVVHSHIVYIKVPLVKRCEPISVGIAFGFVFVFLAWSVLSGAARQINFDFSQIYLYREIAGELLDVGFMPYVNLWAQKVFNPLLLALGLYRRNKLLILFAIVMQVYFFAVTQHRLHLFVPFLVYMVYRLYASNISISRLYFYSTLALVSFLVVALTAKLDVAAAIVLRRAFFVPASATFDWIAYFMEHRKVFFSDNLLASVLVSEYSGESLPFFMGNVVAPGQSVGFNCGIVGAGYAQMGYLGVAFYAFLLGIIVKIVNGLIRGGLPVFIAVAILFAPLRTAWADSDLFTAFLSHGILMCVIVLWLLGRPRQTSCKS